MKLDYIDALILNYMRIKVVEQLKIEGLTTRGQHHRKDRFQPRRPSQAPSEMEASESSNSQSNQGIHDAFNNFQIKLNSFIFRSHRA